MDQRHVHEPFVFAALIIALTAGFGYASVLVAVSALRLPMGAWWMAMAQAHGHAQLFGWAGLFVVGVGLYFLPRLRGTILARIELAPWSLACFVAGITLRSVCQPLTAIVQTTDASLWNILGRFGILASGIIIVVGVALFITMIVSSFRRARPLSIDAPIIPVRPYLALAMISLVVAAILNASLSIHSALLGNSILPRAFDDLLTHVMIYGFIIPIAIALSVRNLPLFMRLASPPKHGLFPIFVLYTAGLVLRSFGYIAPDLALSFTIGKLCENTALAIFIWQLDVLLRRKMPWTMNRTPPPAGYVETRKPTRKNYPDYGEFGRFELLIISAYLWLAFVNLLAIADGVLTLLGNSPFLNLDAERHAITVGFITLLIFGMAVRMVPGFSGKSRVASPRWVMATFYLGNLAALFRVVPLLAPDVAGMNIAFEFSGAIGWLAVMCLAVNLGMTLRQKQDASANDTSLR